MNQKLAKIKQAKDELLAKCDASLKQCDALEKQCNALEEEIQRTHRKARDAQVACTEFIKLLELELLEGEK